MLRVEEKLFLFIMTLQHKLPVALLYFKISHLFSWSEQEHIASHWSNSVNSTPTLFMVKHLLNIASGSFLSAPRLCMFCATAAPSQNILLLWYLRVWELDLVVCGWGVSWISYVHALWWDEKCRTGFDFSFVLMVVNVPRGKENGHAETFVLDFLGFKLLIFTFDHVGNRFLLYVSFIEDPV